VAGTESLRNVTLGRYWSGDSVVHRLDPRTKLIVVGVWTVAIILASAWWMIPLQLALLMLGFAYARLPRSAISGALRPVAVVLAVLAVFQLLFGYEPSGLPGADVVVLALGSLTWTLARLVGVLLSVGRLLSLVLLVNLLTATTRSSELTNGLELLLLPLNRLGLPGHELALTGSIALRFLPIFGEELESVQRARLSREIVRPPSGPWRIAYNARRTASLVVPLFADAFRRVDDLTMAMLARCYQGGQGRTHLRDPRMRRDDYLAMLAALALLVTAVVF